MIHDTPTRPPLAATAVPPTPTATVPQAVPVAAPRRRRWWLSLLVVTGLLAALTVGALGYLASLSGSYSTVAVVAASAEASATPKELERRAAKARGRIATVTARGPYAVVDTYSNRLRIYKGDELLREAVVSTGSQTVLRDPRSGRLWVFETPQGERVIERKTKNPVWNKPDWAFIEEGQLPPKSARDRVDDFSLGDYALYLGDGYLIHGTIFQTLLGNPVTHGCIRVGDKDLEYAYQTLPVGGRVYLF